MGHAKITKLDVSSVLRAGKEDVLGLLLLVNEGRKERGREQRDG